MRRMGVGVAVVAVLLTVTGCKDDSQIGGTGGTGGRDASTAPPGRAASPPPDAIIVRLDDLPSSWTEQPDVARRDASASCLDSAMQTAGAFPPGSSANLLVRSFAQSNLGPFIVAKVATRVDDAQKSFEALVDQVGACNGTTDASNFVTAVTPAKFPTVGDQAFAVQADIANPNGSRLSYFLAVARVDDTLVLAAHIATLGRLDGALVERVVRTMVGRA